MTPLRARAGSRAYRERLRRAMRRPTAGIAFQTAPPPLPGEIESIAGGLVETGRYASHCERRLRWLGPDSIIVAPLAAALSAEAHALAGDTGLSGPQRRHASVRQPGCQQSPDISRRELNAQ